MRSPQLRLLPAFFCTAAILGQQSASAAAEGTTTLPVVILGASVSAGFVDGPLAGGSADNRTVPLKRLIEAWLQPVDATVISAADMAMFLRPLVLGKQQIDRALRHDAAFALGVDFLFWYGYGHIADESRATELRLERLELGLQELERLRCPILVGDLPDMRGAARRMLSPAQIPGPEDLQRLNARIRSWAEARPNVRVFPLAALVARMKEEGITVETSAGAVTVPPGGLLQGDRLHANRLGMAFLGHLLHEEVRQLWHDRKPALPKASFEDFVAAAGAALELQEVAGK